MLAKNRRQQIAFVFGFLVLLLTSHGASSQTVAGRDNRLRYGTRLRWKVFHAPSFLLYFPEGYDSLASFTSRNWDKALERVKRSGLQLPNEPQIILYPSTNALYQSNIGAGLPAFTLPAFVKKGNRLLVPFTGSYSSFEQELYKAAMQGAWESNFASKTGVQLTGSTAIPIWYKEGTIRWMATGWQPMDEDALRELIEQHKPANWQQVAELDPELAGAAFNQYLSQFYFPIAPQGVLAMVRSKQSLSRGQQLVTKKPLDTVAARCLRYYDHRFGLSDPEQKNRDSLQARTWTSRAPKGKLIYYRISPDAKAAAVVMEQGDSRNLWLLDGATGTRKHLARYRLPPWISNNAADSYPLLAWEGQVLWSFTPYKKGFSLRRWEQSGTLTERNTVEGIDGIGSFAPLGTGRFLFSAYRKGQSDLVVYDSRRLRFTPLTSDVYDDGAFALQEPAVPESVLFQSARPSTVDSGRHLWKGIYGLQGGEARAIASDTASWIAWGAPQSVDEARAIAQNTRIGTARWSLLAKGEIPQSLNTGAAVQLLPTIEKAAMLRQKGDSFAVSTEPIGSWLERHKGEEADTTSPWLQDLRKVQAAKRYEDSILRAARDTTPSILSGVFSKLGGAGLSAKQRDSLKEAATFRPSKAKPYVLQLHSAYFTARLSNDYYINRYQPFRTYLGSFKFPELGALAQAGFADLFENHRFTVAYRLPSATQGSDFFVRYSNDRKRTGWGLTYFRKVETLKPDGRRAWKDEMGRTYPASAKVKTHYYEASLNHPLAYDLVIEATAALRYDRTVFLATDRYSLGFDALTSLWALSSVTGTLDRRIATVQPGLYKGYSIKAGIDGFKGIGKDETVLGAVQLKGEWHRPLYKDINLVLRAGAGYSGGGASVRYTMGGVDGAVNPRVDDSTGKLGQAAPYAFSSIVTPLRAYAQNSLYGDQYGLLNGDVYFPLLPLLKKTTAFESLNSLQLGLWADGAMAKEGAGTELKKLWSFGWSARTTLAGYRLRMDWGWPGTFYKPPVWYFSIAVL